MKKIKLTKGKYALVDDGDFEQLNAYKWYYQYNGAAGRGKNITMHRQIMNPPKGMVVDHINHNRLDNRRSNLRICTTTQNNWNSRPNRNKVQSRYIGVDNPTTTNKYGRKYSYWRTQIIANGKEVCIGWFKNEIHAAMAYDLWAKDLRGEYAKTNFKSTQ